MIFPGVGRPGDLLWEGRLALPAGLQGLGSGFWGLEPLGDVLDANGDVDRVPVLGGVRDANGDVDRAVALGGVRDANGDVDRDATRVEGGVLTSVCVERGCVITGSRDCEGALTCDLLSGLVFPPARSL